MPPFSPAGARLRAPRVARKRSASTNVIPEIRSRPETSVAAIHHDPVSDGEAQPGFPASESASGRMAWVRTFPEGWRDGARRRPGRGARGREAANNLADNLQLSGLAPGSTNPLRRDRQRFGNIVQSQYPDLVPSFDPVDSIIDGSSCVACIIWRRSDTSMPMAIATSFARPSTSSAIARGLALDRNGVRAMSSNDEGRLDASRRCHDSRGRLGEFPDSSVGRARGQNRRLNGPRANHPVRGPER